MAQKTNLPIAPQIGGMILLWACYQAALFVYVFDRWSHGAQTINLDVYYTSIATGIGFFLVIIGGVVQYRSLCRLRDHGAVVESEILSGDHWQKYSVAYSYNGTAYKCDGRMAVFNNSVRRTIRRAFIEQRPVQLLVDPARPDRHFVLPFDD